MINQFDHSCILCTRTISGQENWRIPVGEDSAICEDCLVNEFTKFIKNSPGGIAPFVVEGLKSLLSRKRRIMKITKAIRKEVFFKYKNTCCKCNAKEHLTIDHIKPVKLGGNDAISNLQVLCKKCNSSKGANYEKRYERNN